MPESFDLISEPWIPVVGLSEPRHFKVGLEQLLLECQTYRNIQGVTPLETVAIYRLVLALLHTIFDVTDDTWKAMWREGHFERSLIASYLIECQQQNRFDLFDPTHPFFQDVRLDSKPESISSLRGHLASGADSTLFSHNTEQPHLALAPDEAACALLSIQSFGLGGTKGPRKSFFDAPSARGVVFLLEGNNLFETLMLNMIEPDLPAYRLRRNSLDRPAWEFDDPYSDDPARPYGLIDHLTWHNRRVKLVPKRNEQGKLIVEEMRYGIGLRTSDSKNASIREVFNPMHFWRANKNRKKIGDEEGRSHSPIYFDPDKALWRNSIPTLQLGETSDEGDKPLAALLWAQDMVKAGVLEPTRTLKHLAFGAATKSGQDKTYFYRAEVLPLPLKYLEPEGRGLIENLASELSKAEDAYKAVYASLQMLSRLSVYPAKADKELSPDDYKRIRSFADSWGVERYYWSRLELHFHRLIQDLPADAEAAMTEWRKQLRSTARLAFDQAEQYVSADRRAMRAAALAHQHFTRSIYRLLRDPNQPEAQQTDDEDTNRGDV